MTGAICNHYYPKTAEEALILEKLCYHSARLRNTGVYNARQHFFFEKEYIGRQQLSAITRTNENYKMLICDIGDQTINHVHRDFRSYSGAKEAATDKDKVRLPKYLGKEEIWSFFVAGRSVREKADGYHIGLTREFREMYGITMKDLVLDIHIPGFDRKLSQLEVKPRFGGEFYDVTIVHNDKEEAKKEKAEAGSKEITTEPKTAEEPKEKLSKAKKSIREKIERLLGLDPGVDNILAGYAYPDGDMFLIKGLAIKAMNQWYNKRKAEIQSIYDIQKVSNGQAMVLLTMKRENFMDNELNNIAKLVVDYAIEHRIDKIVAGWNKGIKQGINIGKASNQKFVSIPYRSLYQKIKYRCEKAGIGFEEIEEDHTSKCSAIDREEICHHETYMGKRIRRGLFRTAKGYLINADINGAMNIVRRYLKSKQKADISPRLCRAASTGHVRVLERTWAKPGNRQVTRQNKAPSSIGWSR